MDRLSDSQIICLLRAAFYRENINKLLLLHGYIDKHNFSNILNYQFYLQTKIYVSLKNGNHNELVNLIKNNTFDQRFHEYLQEIIQKNVWYQSFYNQFEQNKNHKIGAVDRFRIRKKYPFPKSIWNGEKIFYSFSEKCVSILNEYYVKNKYPCCQIKEEIVEKTGLTHTRVTNWFKNKRQRERIRMLKSK